MAAPRYGDILEINGKLVEFTPVGYMPVSPERDISNKTITKVPSSTGNGMFTSSSTKKALGESDPFDPAGGPVGGPSTPTTAPDTGGIKPARDVKGDEPEAPSEMTFTFFRGAERGDASPTSLYGSREAEQLTEAELREYFEGDTVNRLPEVFGTFDNYLAYMTEREELIQAGDYDVGDWDEYTGSLTEDELMILEGEDLTQYGDDANMTYAELYGFRTQNQASAYNRWINSEENQALLAKYGINDTVYSESGDKFRWNGSAYVKTVDVSHAGLTDYVKIGMQIAAGSFLGGAGVGKDVAALLNLSGSSAAALSAAVNSVVSTVGSSVLTGEDIDITLESIVQSAISGGLLDTDTAQDILKALETGNELADAVIQAGVINSVTQLATSGDLDPEQLAEAMVRAGLSEQFRGYLENLEEMASSTADELREFFGGYLPDISAIEDFLSGQRDLFQVDIPDYLDQFDEIARGIADAVEGVADVVDEDELEYRAGAGYVDPGSYYYYTDENGNRILGQDIEGLRFTF